MNILIMVLVVTLTFILTEVFNTFSNKKETGSKVYFSFIGVQLTEKDIQRFVMSIIISMICLILFHYFKPVDDFKQFQFLGDKINVNIDVFKIALYIIIGFAPSSVIKYAQDKIKEKIDK